MKPTAAVMIKFGFLFRRFSTIVKDNFYREKFIKPNFSWFFKHGSDPIPTNMHDEFAQHYMYGST